MPNTNKLRQIYAHLKCGRCNQPAPKQFPKDYNCAIHHMVAHEVDEKEIKHIFKTQPYTKSILLLNGTWKHRKDYV